MFEFFVKVVRKSMSTFKYKCFFSNDLDPLRKRAIFVALLLSYRLSRNYYRAADFITFLRRIELHNGSKIKLRLNFFIYEISQEIFCGFIVFDTCWVGI